MTTFLNMKCHPHYKFQPKMVNLSVCEITTLLSAKTLKLSFVAGIITTMDHQNVILYHQDY